MNHEDSDIMDQVEVMLERIAKALELQNHMAHLAYGPGAMPRCAVCQAEAENKLEVEQMARENARANR